MQTNKNEKSELPRLGDHVVNVQSDIPDFRDRMYDPWLAPLDLDIAPPENLTVLDQKREGACTGFGLAAVINLLSERQGGPQPVSARMLYEMARRFDEWPGEEYSGSSCRGAIKGWYNMGVCQDATWPYVDGRSGTLTVRRAIEAREITIGAYYRVRPAVVDYHAALNETGVIYASAAVHQGWMEPVDGRIPLQLPDIGGHAFAIVGYSGDGFYVQNSWGPGWGEDGVALWTYEDWQANIKDAWVVQLARPTPQIFPGFGRSALEGSAEKTEKAPRRNDIMGHFVHLDDGRFHDTGRYFSNLEDVKQTATRLADSEKYDHLLLYAHGGLNSTSASARRIFALKDTFKSNRIYPYHFMYDTGLLEEIKDILLGRRKDVDERMEGITDWSDRFIEFITRRPGRAIWREMKMGARSPFSRKRSDGTKVLNAFLDAFRRSRKPKQIHLVGHSTGGILIAHLLARLCKSRPKLAIGTISLLAPAATLDDFTKIYEPLLPRVSNMTVYNLTDELEAQDNVAAVYRKSLLYLVSRAFEKQRKEALLGMERYSRTVKGIEILYSEGSIANQSRTASRTHGGFDNDPATMNDISHRVLGHQPEVPFTKENLQY